MRLCSHFLRFGMVILLVSSTISCLPGSERSHDFDPDSNGKLEVKTGQSWSGEIAIGLRKEIPSKGYVSDQESWAKLWKAYRGEEKVPEIDFVNEMVLVVAGMDPNRISIQTQLNDQGDLTLAYESTLVAFNKPSKAAYHFLQISRKGIKTIKGMPIE